MRQAYRVIILLNVALLLFSGATPATARDEAIDTVGRIPASIHQVHSGGFWTLGGDEGIFRVIVTAQGFEHVTHRLFIQWLQVDVDRREQRVIRTVGMKELDSGHGRVLEVETSFGAVNAFEIRVTAESRDGDAEKFSITAAGDGNYAIQPR